MQPAASSYSKGTTQRLSSAPPVAPMCVSAEDCDAVPGSESAVRNSGHADADAAPGRRYHAGGLQTRPHICARLLFLRLPPISTSRNAVQNDRGAVLC